MRTYTLISLLILLLIPIVLEANDDDKLMPYQMITVSIDSMTQRLGDETNKKRLGKNKAELYQIIDETLSPYFQKKYAGRLVLNNYWKDSSESQRERFTEGLYQSLIRSYALTMLNFDVSKIKVISGNISLEELKKLTVKSEVDYKGEVIPMNFSFAKFKQGWMFYDVRIEGVSYIKNYRNQFNAEISANGLESVILRLESLKD
ncbi:MAG: ABC transporter substrate-binding protein [Gammaproteobacteria bacterium]|nr:ABC transporter substrate-binding protein [Gammaproteobacteria bacterium]